MYIIRNRTDGTEQRCDAIEYVRAEGAGCAPAEQAMADGFKAQVLWTAVQTNTLLEE